MDSQKRTGISNPYFYGRERTLGNTMVTPPKELGFAVN